MQLLGSPRGRLSAEPLVGLKHARSGRNAVASCAFSRTPRGFEARSSDRRVAEDGLSAEPLVGLKQEDREARGRGQHLSAEPLVGLKQHRAVL